MFFIGLFIVCPVVAYLCGEAGLSTFNFHHFGYVALNSLNSECQKLRLWDTQLIIAGKGNPPCTNQVAMFLDQGLFEDTQSLFMSFLGVLGMDKVIYIYIYQQMMP